SKRWGGRVPSGPTKLLRVVFPLNATGPMTDAHRRVQLHAAFSRHLRFSDSRYFNSVDSDAAMRRNITNHTSQLHRPCKRQNSAAVAAAAASQAGRCRSLESANNEQKQSEVRLRVMDGAYGIHTYVTIRSFLLWPFVRARNIPLSRRPTPCGDLPVPRHPPPVASQSSYAHK